MLFGLLLWTGCGPNYEELAAAEAARADSLEAAQMREYYAKKEAWRRSPAGMAEDSIRQRENDSIRSRAQQDYHKGIKIYTVHGTVEGTHQLRYFVDHTQKKYGVDIDFSCVFPFQNHLYRLEMIRLIEAEFGKDFIHIADSCAQEAYQARFGAPCEDD